MFVLNTVEVEVRGVSDSALVDAVEQTVRHTFSHLVGAWQVRVSASNEPGRWDLRVRGSVGHYVAQFLAVPDRLANSVERRLRAFLRAVVAPLSAVPQRPMLIAPSVQASVDVARAS
jgi:hypothetical protein